MFFSISVSDNFEYTINILNREIIDNLKRTFDIISDVSKKI